MGNHDRKNPLLDVTPFELAEGQHERKSVRERWAKSLKTWNRNDQPVNMPDQRLVEQTQLEFLKKGDRGRFNFFQEMNRRLGDETGELFVFSPLQRSLC